MIVESILSHRNKTIMVLIDRILGIDIPLYLQGSVNNMKTVRVITIGILDDMCVSL